jgi:hypothetical protein
MARLERTISSNTMLRAMARLNPAMTGEAPESQSFGLVVNKSRAVNDLLSKNLIHVPTNR